MEGHRLLILPELLVLRVRRLLVLLERLIWQVWRLLAPPVRMFLRGFLVCRLSTTSPLTGIRRGVLLVGNRCVV